MQYSVNKQAVNTFYGTIKDLKDTILKSLELTPEAKKTLSEKAIEEQEFLQDYFTRRCKEVSNFGRVSNAGMNDRANSIQTVYVKLSTDGLSKKAKAAVDKFLKVRHTNTDGLGFNKYKEYIDIRDEALNLLSIEFGTLGYFNIDTFLCAYDLVNSRF